MLRVADTNRRPGGTFSPAGTILITSQTPKLYVNTSFPTQTLIPTIYYQSNGALVHNNNFPPVGSPFILALKLPQTATEKIVARFQGISYDSFNSNSGWTGDFAEMIVYKKKNLTENQSNLVVAYLANKWGFSLADSSPPLVLPNVKPFSDFTPLSFKPIVWYDSSDSQITKSLKTLGNISNNNTVKCVSNGSDVSNVTPSFGIPSAVMAGKLGAFSGLAGTCCSERTMNGLNTIYVDDETALLYDNGVLFGTSSNKLTNIFFVGRQGQYSGQFSQWNPILTYSDTGGDNIIYNGYTFISLAVAGNINQVPPTDGTSTSYWKPVVKYQTIFGNLGYSVSNPNDTTNSNNILLGGKTVRYIMSQISSNTTVTSVASQASNSTYALSANVFNTFTTGDTNVNSNLLKATAACYSLNQLGTAQYQTTSAATQFVKAVTMTAETVLYPLPASPFLLSLNGIQASGTQNTPFRGFFYDNVSSKDGWSGDFAEIITFTKNLSPQEILLVEGYLATKWGLQNALPPSHPFLYSNTTSECFSGYSPLEFSTIGADVNSSNDQFAISGIPSIISVPKEYYTSDTIVTTLNNLNLPTGLSVEIQSGTSNQLTWINAAEDIDYEFSCTPTAASVFGIEPAPTYFLVPRSSSATAPNNFNLLPLTVDSQILTIFGGTGVGTNVTLIDGKYNGDQLAAMIQKAILDKVGTQILTVQFGSRSTNLTFTNTTPKDIVSSAGYFGSKMLGLISPSASQPIPPAEDSTFFTIPANSFFDFPFSLQTITALSICKWDGQVECPTNYAQVDSDSNELALPFAKRCAKPFSLLLPQVLTNAGLSNQSFSCPIGTELIGKNQNADPEHPVCSYVCDPPYYDSGTTCGYFPVYSPGDESSINILNDNSSANITQVNLADTSKGSTSSALRFMILAVIVSFLIGLAIKAFPTLTANPPTENAAGSVLESVIQSQSQSLKNS